MRTKYYLTVFAAVFGTLTFGQNSGSAQAIRVKPMVSGTSHWIQLQDYIGKPSRPVWVNLERADTISFYKTNYGTQKNVSQASVTLGRNVILVIEPKEITLLHRYVQTH